MFAVTAVCVLIVAASIKLMEEDPPVARQTHSPWRLLLHDRELLVLFIATLLVGGALHINFTFGPVYMLRLGGDASAVGWLIGLSAGAEIPMMFVGGALLQRMGGLRSLLLSYGLFLAGYLLGLAAWAPWVLLAAAVPTGMGFGLFFVATVLTFDRRAPDHWSASIQAMVSVGAFGLAPIIASFAGGLIYDAWPVGIYAASAGLALIAAGALVLLLLGWGRPADTL
jgi:PPP family 3-phenylpropionic acid transporter